MTYTVHADALATLHRLQTTGLGFITERDVATLAAHDDTRLIRCLVRCGACRFIAPAQDVQHLIAIIEADGRDYVRDVSLQPTESR